MSWWQSEGRVTVAHFREEFLPISETFIHDVIVRTRGQRPVVVYGVRANAGHFPLPPGSLWTERVFRSPYQDAPELADRLRERGVQVAHAHFGWDLPLAAVAAGELRVPLIVSFHGKDASLYLRDERWVRLYRRLLPAAAAVVIDYRGIARRLIRLGAAEDRVHVIRTGIDLSFWPAWKPPRRPGPIRLASVGRLVPKKGHRLLLEAFAQATSRGLDAELTILGDGPEREPLRQLGARLGLGGRFRLMPRTRAAGIRTLLRSSDLFALPSLTDESGDEETTPLVLKEASACRLPVLATRHAGIPDVVQDGVTGLLVEEGSVPALTEGLLRLVAERARWEAMGAAGRARMEVLFGLEHTLNRWRTLYRALAQAETPA